VLEALLTSIKHCHISFLSTSQVKIWYNGVLMILTLYLQGNLEVAWAIKAYEEAEMHYNVCKFFLFIAVQK